MELIFGQTDSLVRDGSGSVPHTATDKVALLIGNMNYLHHTPLCAPICDVHELTNLLRQMDFKVVSLLDLSWQEMQNAVAEFLMLLDKGVYGQFCWPDKGCTMKAGSLEGRRFLSPLQDCCTLLVTAMRTMATASWFLLTHRPPTHLITACAYRASSAGCRRSRPDSTCSCWTCVGKETSTMMS